MTHHLIAAAFDMTPEASRAPRPSSAARVAAPAEALDAPVAANGPFGPCIMCRGPEEAPASVETLDAPHAAAPCAFCVVCRSGAEDALASASAPAEALDTPYAVTVCTPCGFCKAPEQMSQHAIG